MKTKINGYLLRSLKENFHYILFFLVVIILYASFGLILANKIGVIEIKTGNLSQEIIDLKRKAELVNYKQEIIKEGIDLKETNNLLTKLVPNEGDYFSIINALEEISNKTDFLIVGYIINPKSSSTGTLSLTIEGKGDQKAFFNFLEDYRYVGQRLITVDKIDYRALGFTQVRLNVNFYNGKPQEIVEVKNVKLTENEKKLIQTIKSKIRLNLDNELDNQTASESFYPVKSNPF